MDFEINKKESGFSVSQNGVSVCTIKNHSGNKNISASDEMDEIENGFYNFRRVFKNISGSAQSVVLSCECETYFAPDFYMIPAVSYNGNRWGAGGEPKGLEKYGQPWVFACNRTALPCATFSEDAKFSVGLFADARDEQSLKSSCSMSRTKRGMLHKIIFPEREEPLVYSGRDEYLPAHTPDLVLESGGELSVSFFVSVSLVDKINFGWIKAFDRAQRLFKKEIKGQMAAEKFWRLRAEFIRETQYTEAGPGGRYQLFEMGLLPNGRDYHFRHGKNEAETKNVSFLPRAGDDHRFEIGWCGQNASESVALIYDYIWNGNEESLRKGAGVLDTWTRHAPFANGLFVTQFDEIVNEDEQNDFEIDTCNLGWGIWQALEAYKALKRIGIEKPEYLSFARNACDFFVSRRASDGSFGKSWNRDGTERDPAGTIGCFILIGMVEMHKVSGDDKYLGCAAEMFKFYAERDLYKMECTAGALDTHCIDKETCWPLLKTGLDLYEITGEKLYLNDAALAAYYILSFTFQYDALYGDETDFTKLNYSTYGGTSVSTQHHHLDPWGSLIAYDFHRLYKITGEEKWKTWFEALWRNAMLGVSDGSLVVHGLTRPASTQNEMFANCRFAIMENESPGMFNDWLQSWPGAFKLVSIIRAVNDGYDIAELFDEV